MKRGLRVLLLSDSWVTFAVGMLGPIYALFVKQIGGDLLDASWAFFTFMITTGIVMFIFSRIEDRIKHKNRVVVIGYCFTALGFLSYYFVDSQATLLFTQVILGLGEAIRVPSFDALYSKYLSKNKAASEWGNWETMWYVVTAIAALVGGYVVNQFGFKWLFILMFIASIFSIFSSMWLFKERKYLNSK